MTPGAAALSADPKPPLLLGECPSKGGDRYHMVPLSGPPARVLCDAAGIPPDGDGSGRYYWALREHYDTLNLFERHVPKWSGPDARRRAQEIRGSLPKVTVLLGARVAAAFCVTPFEPGKIVEWIQEPVAVQGGVAGRHCYFVVAYHPSGLNRKLNDPKERAKMGVLLRDARYLAQPGAYLSVDNRVVLL